MKQQSLKLDYKKTGLIGFGFFASSIAWSVYNANVPLILEQYVDKAVYIGFIMALDNMFAVIFQPMFGALSDKTHSKRGRRLPYMLIGIPICAILFSIIPWMKSLIPLMLSVIVFNFVMSTWRAPAVALMPDVTPAPLRSKANGVINLMGGLGAVFAFLVGGYLLRFGVAYPFIFTSIMMMIAWVLLYFFVFEPERKAEEEEIIEEVASSEEKSSMNRSLLFILLAIFFWFTGYNAIETYFTLYATNVLKVTGSVATMTLTFFSLALVAGAIPAGFIGTKFGRKRTIRVGLIGMIVLFGIQLVITDITVIRISFIFAGLCWALININSLPMVVEIAKSNRIGKFTGYYYFFSSTAAILSPPLFGLIYDWTKNYNYLFVFSVVGFIMAFICISFAKHGEVEVTKSELASGIKSLED